MHNKTPTGPKPLISHLNYKLYSGPRISGVVPYDVQGATHLEKAFWVTSAVETNAKFGSINMYDGTGATAYLHQSIAVYPKELSSEDFNPADDQGGFWKALARMPMTDAKDALMWAFAAECWELEDDGVLKYRKDKTIQVSGRKVQARAGQLVYGADIRNVLTPFDGRVPAKGAQWEQSCFYATLLHNLTKDPATFAAQVADGLEYTLRDLKRIKLSTGQSVLNSVYGGSVDSKISPEVDLAMCMAISHSVNAPAIAQRCLNTAIAADKKAPGQFPYALVQAMATSNWGKWHWQQVGGGGRYVRTRAALLKLNEKLKCWDDKMFKAGGVCPPSF